MSSARPDRYFPWIQITASPSVHADYSDWKLGLYHNSSSGIFRVKLLTPLPSPFSARILLPKTAADSAHSTEVAAVRAEVRFSTDSDFMGIGAGPAPARCTASPQNLMISSIHGYPTGCMFRCGLDDLLLITKKRDNHSRSAMA